MLAQLEALLDAASTPATIVNWSGDAPVTVQEWCAYAAELTGTTANVVVNEVPGVAKGAVADHDQASCDHRPVPTWTGDRASLGCSRRRGGSRWPGTEARSIAGPSGTSCAHRYLRPRPDAPGVVGARRAPRRACSSSDVERTIRFYQDLLEFPLTELFENRDYQGSTHFFFDIGNGNALAFFDFPGLDLGPYAEVLGGLHHLAISVEPERWEHLKAQARRRRRSRRSTSTARRSTSAVPTANASS